MSETNTIPNGNVGAGDAPQASSSVKKPKALSVEKIYQKKSQLEHILLRPDTYIGSVERVTEQQWLFNEETNLMERREISYVPGLYKIFDEILVNAADNKQRDAKMNSIKISIDKERNVISVYNNGQGIPVVTHKEEKMFVPTMIFGHLLTSSNYDDEEEKVTGGRNGYGAKLCNIFSTEFSVETASSEYHKAFKQTWKNNMSVAGEPKIKDFSGKDYTKVTFSPDLTKFKMECLEQDIIDLMIRRALDIAGSTGVYVHLNDKKLPVHNFVEYVHLFIPKTDDSPKVIFEKVDRWEVALSLSESGFQQMSFVNSIATTKGGRHIDHVADAITKNVLEKANKKHKGQAIKPFQVRNHMWLFINCLINNPSFDSQTKENMTTQLSKFGSKCLLTEKFFKSVEKNLGLTDVVINWAKFKEEQKMVQKSSKKKTLKLLGMNKLEDANWAGGKNSLECTLILTEGDSAKTLAVSGLGVIGRDKYGVFPLRGKLLNVREASSKQVMENAEINNVVKILGLVYKKKYESVNDLKSLRYGKLMIMTDQDQDGSHIKGLLINFIHYNWPSLLRLPFLEEFITPIVKASKGNEVKSFFSLPEFEEWKAETDNWHTYTIKYYKGLGTSTSNEAKEYFRDMTRHRVKFVYSGPNDDSNICMAFSKKLVEQRKEWLTQWMETVKQRREMGLPEDYLYEKDTSQVNYSDFVNKELVLFSNSDNERSIPSIMDGFKPGQRKVLYTCFKRNDKREVKVAQLAGSVAEHSAYHHGEVSLMSTIVNLAQNFVGSNNINVLQPIGQFGTRLGGGKDQASPRYINTMLSPLTRLIFPISDDPLLISQYDDNLKIEPVYYVPIIPMVLVNGAEGIGTAWSTKIPNHNPRDLAKNLLKMLDGEEPTPMVPWYKNFRGTIEPCAQSQSRYICFGEIATLDETTLEITELPIGTWTDSYKSVLETMLGDGKNGSILDYKEHNTDLTVRFVVELSRQKLERALDEGLHKFFKLQTNINTTSMVLFDENGCLKKYDTVLAILKQFFKVRLDYYVKRKLYMEGAFQAECRKLSNQARFILEKCKNEITIENKKRVEMVQELERRGYDSDPVRLWKLSHNKDEALVEENDDSDEKGNESLDKSAKKYDYLLSMPLWNLTLEKKNELLKKRDEKLQEYDLLKKKTPESLWKHDLGVFLEKLEEVERKEREDNERSSSAKGKKGGGKKVDVEPSKYGTRVIPKLDAETMKKFEKEAKPKVKRVKKTEVVDDDRDEFDELGDKPIKSLKDRLGNSPEAIEKKLQAKRKNLKQTKLPNMKKKKSGSDEDFDSGSDFSDSAEKQFVTPPERSSSRRTAASKVKYNFSDESGGSHDEDMEDGENGIESVFNSVSKTSNETEEKKSPPVEEDSVVISGTDSEFEQDPPAPKFPGGSEAMFDSLLSGDSPIVDRVVEKKAPAKKPTTAGRKKQPAKRVMKNDSDSDDMFSKITSKKGRKNQSDDEDWSPVKEGGGGVSEGGASRGGRKRTVAKYTMDSDDDDDDEF